MAAARLNLLRVATFGIASEAKQSRAYCAGLWMAASLRTPAMTNWSDE
jgi:hypothetical protein